MLIPILRVSPVGIVVFIEMLKKKLLNFPPKKQQDLEKLMVRLQKIDEKLEKVRAEKDELSSHYKTMVPEEQKKIVINTLYRGVLVSIDQNKMLTEYTYKLVSIFSKEGEMKVNFKSRFI